MNSTAIAARSFGELPPPVSPRGLWLKTHIYQRGHHLHARTYLVAAGRPEVFTVRVDLRPILRRVARYHQLLHGGQVSGCIGCSGDRVGASFWGAVKKTASKVAKGKLVAKVSASARVVIKSKITGGALLAASVVLPPVGTPALAAYTTANAALAAYENGQKVVAAVRAAPAKVKASARVKAAARVKMRTNLKARAHVKAKARVRLKAKLKLARRRGATRAQLVQMACRDRAKVQAALPRPAAGIAPAQRAKAAQVIKEGRKAKLLVRTIQRKPKVRAAARKATLRARVIQKQFRTISTVARYGQKAHLKLHAQKMARIIHIAAEARARLRGIAYRSQGKAAAGAKGLVIDNRGRVLTGRFVLDVQAKAAVPQLMLAAKGKVMPGTFRRIGGCVGCI